MKLFRNILIATSALALAVACQPAQEEGKGDATIGFDSPTYVYKESAGRVKLPVKFEGEPKTYPISFDVEVSLTTAEEGIELADLVHFTQTEGLKYVGNPDAPAYIEFDLKDNDFINDSRFITLQLSNVKGAEVVGEGKTVIELADNDNNPYERLMGNWVAQCYDSDGAKAEWNVNISGGFTSDEENVNFEKTLVCWGFGGQMEDVSSYGITPAKQPVWYLTYDAEAKTLTTQPGKVMANIWSFNGIDEDVEVIINKVEEKPSGLQAPPRPAGVPAVLERKQSKYTNIEAELRIPSYKRRNMELVVRNDDGVARRKQELRDDNIDIIRRINFSKV